MIAVFLKNMEFDLDDFVAKPSLEKFHAARKSDLVAIAAQFEIPVIKQEKKKVIFCSLIEQNVLPPPESTTQGDVGASPSEVRKMELELEMRRLELREKELQHQVEMRKLELEAAARRDSARVSVDQDGSSAGAEFDINKCICLVPPFTELDVDKYFILFERVAKTLRCPQDVWPLLLQCVFTGKAQEAYASLSPSDSLNYDKVKSAVEKAYELMPVAYRQKFRRYKKADHQSYTELGRVKTALFDRWCAAQDVKNCDQLRDLMLLEEFKNCLPEDIATYINEQKAKNISVTAGLADEYVLTHKDYSGSVGFKRYFGRDVSRSDRVGGVTKQMETRQFKNPVVRDDNRVCHYCHRRGHIKEDCHQPKGETKKIQTAPKGVGLAAPVRSPLEDTKNTPSSEVGVSYLPFIREGYVSLSNGEGKVRVKILRDTGAFDSFIRADVLPFSAESETDACVPILGMGLNMMFLCFLIANCLLVTCNCPCALLCQLMASL
ncbi:uncharacterized protein LOC129357032 [Poeciliopsis prolifica]|uniref:uncharacterized protein LOC129357032 n=1 Tax=Poeciliopsis prolifica TaxID=188132 RepID=UPI00241449C5|nr:uncharacterized protein LOC129357032 [Poeciliopsis prolifica]